MSKYYLMTIEHIKTFCQGALGAMTFGAYSQYTNNKLMELNNETMIMKNNNKIDSIELKHRQDMKELEEKLEKNHRMEMDELKKDFQLQIQQIQSRRWF
jgi:hypothetical protein